LIQESRAAKTSYKHNREKLVDCSAALENCVEEVDSARQELLREFDDWYVRSYTPTSTWMKSSIASNDTKYMKDVVDDDEHFDQLQVARVMAEEPESLAFVRARQAVRLKKR